MKQTAPTAIAEALAEWCHQTSFEKLPADVIAATKLRILDMLGLALVGRTFDVGQAILAGLDRREETGRATIMGGPARVPAATAALANGALAEAIEFDDTHNETVVHVSSPVVAAALAGGEAVAASGREFIRAVALGSEVACRAALGAPGAFHPRGFHPTGIFGVFGSAAAACVLKRSRPGAIVSALGISGSFASGLLESWTDGTWAKTIHPGWAAQGGLLAADLASVGFTGPKTIFEGRSGLYASHVRDPAVEFDFHRIAAELGHVWESRAISLKPYPNAHVLHGVLDAVLGLLAERKVEASQVESIECSVAAHMVGLVCEPSAEKRRPASPAQARISLPHSVAELIRYGRMDVTNYTTETLADPLVQDLAARVEYRVEPSWTSRAVYPGGVLIRLKDGSILQRVEQANLGSSRKPMSAGQVEAKFRRNAGLVLAEDRIEEIVETARRIEQLGSVADLTRLCVASGLVE